jgi:hypothetical protein
MSVATHFRYSPGTIESVAKIMVIDHGYNTNISPLDIDVNFAKDRGNKRLINIDAVASCWIKQIIRMSQQEVSRRLPVLRERVAEWLEDSLCIRVNKA